MRTQTRWTHLAMAALLPWAMACSESGTTGPAGGGAGAASGGDVSLSIAVPGGTPGSPAFTAPGLFDVVVTGGGSTLTITRVAMVLREIELERMNDDDCDDHLPGELDDCEEFSSGPILLELPLDGSVDQVIALDNVPADVYDEVEFEIHKPDDDTPADLDFLAAHPEFRRVSIWVEGDFDGSPFTFLSDLNEDQEKALVPPITVDGTGGPVNVTLSIDVSTWFLAPGGGLIDPASANKGGPNENVVKENIKQSIELFEDSDFDGSDDSSDD